MKRNFRRVRNGFNELKPGEIVEVMEVTSEAVFVVKLGGPTNNDLFKMAHSELSVLEKDEMELVRILFG